jgi:hypothetical protein
MTVHDKKKSSSRWSSARVGNHATIAESTWTPCLPRPRDSDRCWVSWFLNDKDHARRIGYENLEKELESSASTAIALNTMPTSARSDCSQTVRCFVQQSDAIVLAINASGVRLRLNEGRIHTTGKRTLHVLYRTTGGEHELDTSI